MSYVLTIPHESINNFQITDWESYFASLVKGAKAQFPARDFLKAEVKIENKIFKGQVLVTGIIEFGIEFYNCYFTHDVVFYEVEIKGEVRFNKCFFDNEFRIMESSKFLREFNLIDVKSKHQVLVLGGEFNVCKWTIKDNAVLKISGGNYKLLNIGYWGDGCILKETHINLGNVSGVIELTNNKTQIIDLFITGLSINSTFAVDDIQVNCFTISEYRNEKNLRLFNLQGLQHEKESVFSIANSYLGKAEFYSIDFNSFDNFLLIDSQLVDCSFVNIKWKYKIRAFKSRKIYQSPLEVTLQERIALIEENALINSDIIQELKEDKEVINYYIKLRENYRQIKYALSKQGDTINEQKFHTQEMLAYNKTLTIKGSLGTKLIVKFSYFFSDFGQSISRPFFSLLIGHLFLLFILIATKGISNLEISPFNSTDEGFKAGFYYYFKFINPLRKGEDLNGYHIILDILMRIWSSYMIYNIIRATRRFIK